MNSRGLRFPGRQPFQFPHQTVPCADFINTAQGFDYVFLDSLSIIVIPCFLHGKLPLETADTGVSAQFAQPESRRLPCQPIGVL